MLPTVLLDSILTGENVQLRLVSREFNLLIAPKVMASVTLDEPNGNYEMITKFGFHTRELIFKSRRSLTEEELDWINTKFPNLVKIGNIDVSALTKLNLPKLKHVAMNGQEAHLESIRIPSIEINQCRDLERRLGSGIQQICLRNSSFEFLENLSNLKPHLKIRYSFGPSYESRLLEKVNDTYTTFFLGGGDTYSVFMEFETDHFSSQDPEIKERFSYIQNKPYQQLRAHIANMFDWRFLKNCLRIMPMLPPLRCIDYCFMGHNSKGPYLVLTQLTEANHLILRWDQFPFDPIFPEIQYRATELSIHGKPSKSFFPWVASCFPHLRFLELNHTVTSEESIHNISFDQILHLRARSNQPLDFWHRIICASPNLQVIETDHHLLHLRLKYPHICFAHT